MPRQVRRSADCGYSRHACSSFWIYPATSAGETPWGSRQGTGGRDDGETGTAAFVVTSACDIGGVLPFPRFVIRLPASARTRDTRARPFLECRDPRARLPASRGDPRQF